MLDRTLLRHFDWVLLGLLIVNCLIGVAAIYSSSHYLTTNYAVRQVFLLAVGMILLVVLLALDYNHLVTYAVYFYFGCLAILAGILVFGKLIAGTKSWIRLPFFQIQPSEITKVVVILMLARIFAEFRKPRITLGRGFLSGAVVGVPFCLVALQPDLGTALNYVPIFIGALILAGIDRRMLALLLIVAILAGLFGWNFLLKDYQKQRILTLLSPGEDPLGSGYHILQSKIAVGSGGFLGKGYMKGTQSQLRFLPARHTDFIFSVIGEEFGFLGVVITLTLFFLMLLRMFQSLMLARDRTGVYLVFMIFILFTGQFFINVLMTIGLFPVAGIPLPLLSYGGSSLITNCIAVSLVMNVRMRRFVNV